MKLRLGTKSISVGAKYLTGSRASIDRKSTRLNSSHLVISYAVFCLQKNTRLNSSHLVISYAVFCLKKKTKAAPTSRLKLHSYILYTRCNIHCDSPGLVHIAMLVVVC